MASVPARVAVMGASGAIGAGLVSWFSERGWEVLAVSRQWSEGSDTCTHVRRIAWNPLLDDVAPPELDRLDAVVWAQGANGTDDIGNMDYAEHLRMYDANVGYILRSLQTLLNSGRLASTGARLCVISSIWQDIARQSKLSYCITKSALQGLVRSVSLDLAEYGHVINAVLPGALDTPMTRANLSVEQLARLEDATPGHVLARVEDVAATVEFCCSPAHRAITGQFITVDRGFSHARIV